MLTFRISERCQTLITPPAQIGASPEHPSNRGSGLRSRIPLFRRVVYVLIIYGIILLSGEIATRLLVYKPSFQPFPPDVQKAMLVPHPTRSYTYAPDFSARIVTNDYTVELKTNQLGLRDDPIVGRREKVRMLAVGDSFTFGFGVEANQTWPKQLQSMLSLESDVSGPVRVINAGISGYGLRQMRLLLGELFDDLRPDLVIVGVYPQAYRRLQDPFVYFHGYAMSASQVPTAGMTEDGFLFTPFTTPWARALDFWLDEHFRFAAYLLKLPTMAKDRWSRPHTDAAVESSTAEAGRQLEPLLKEIALIDQFAHSKGTSAVVLLITPQLKNGLFEREAVVFNAAINSYCADRGIPVVDPLPEFQRLSDGTPKFRNGADYHWSPEAHRIAADKLARSLRQQRLF